MRASFPINKPMIGSVMDLTRDRGRQLGPLKIVTYPDSTNHKLLGGKRRKVFDPVVKFPGMNGQHSHGSSLLEKLKKMMAGGKQPEGEQHALGVLSSRPKAEMMDGYEAVKENRDWRKY